MSQRRKMMFETAKNLMPIIKNILKREDGEFQLALILATALIIVGAHDKEKMEKLISLMQEPPPVWGDIPAQII